MEAEGARDAPPVKPRLSLLCFFRRSENDMAAVAACAFAAVGTGAYLAYSRAARLRREEQQREEQQRLSREQRCSEYAKEFEKERQKHLEERQKHLERFLKEEKEWEKQQKDEKRKHERNIAAIRAYFSNASSTAVAAPAGTLEYVPSREYLTYVLHQIFPDNPRINAQAVASLQNTLGMIFAKVVEPLAGRSLTASEEIEIIEAALHALLGPEVDRHAIAEGKKAVEKSGCDDSDELESWINAFGTGHFPDREGRWPAYGHRIQYMEPSVAEIVRAPSAPTSPMAVVYLAGAMEYLVADFLEVAGKAASAGYASAGYGIGGAVKLEHITAAFQRDEELKRVSDRLAAIKKKKGRGAPKTEKAAVKKTIEKKKNVRR